MTKSDSPIPPARPVSWFAIVAILVSFAMVPLVVAWIYRPAPAPLPYNDLPENATKDEAATATPETRLAYLVQLRASQAAQLAGYSWKDPNKKDIVRIPIERAMELVVKENGK